MAPGMEGRRERGGVGCGEGGLGHVSEDSCWTGEHSVGPVTCQKLMGIREKQEGRAAEDQRKRWAGLLRVRARGGRQVPKTSQGLLCGTVPLALGLC